MTDLANDHVRGTIRHDLRVLIVALVAVALTAFGVGLLVGALVSGSPSSCVEALDMAKQGALKEQSSNATMEDSVRQLNDLVRFAELDHDCRGLRPTDLG